MTRCACGYLDTDHLTDRCPLCTCGKTPDEHLPVMRPPAPVVAETYTQVQVCPGRPLTASGALPTLRLGTLRAPLPDPERREWFGMSVPVIPAPKEAPVAIPPPRIAMTPPTGPSTIPKNAIAMGRKALAADWRVVALYSMGHDGTEGCSLRMSRGEQRMVALWERAPGQAGTLTGWSASDGYAWGPVGLPQKINHKAISSRFEI